MSIQHVTDGPGRDVPARPATYEVRFCELRQTDDRVLTGTIVRFNDEARIAGMFRERINKGALEPRSDMILNASHNRALPLARMNGPDSANLTLRETTEALEIRARIVDTSIGNDALANVRAGLLTGFSVEMAVHEDDWREDATLRIVRRATLHGIALVDRPAYPQSSVEAREAVIRADFAGYLRKHPRLSYFL